MGRSYTDGVVDHDVDPAEGLPPSREQVGVGLVVAGGVERDGGGDACAEAIAAEEAAVVVADIGVVLQANDLDIVQLNRRTVHRAMDHMGLRHAIRAGTELCSLGTKLPSFQAFVDGIQVKGLTAALQKRDAPFGDYRAADRPTAAD